MSTIKDRTGRTIPQELVDKATRIVRTGGVRREVPSRLWKVEGDTDTYLVAVNRLGESACRCRWGRETGELCSHQMAVWVYQDSIGEPVRMVKIDGPVVRLVDDVADDEIFDDL